MSFWVEEKNQSPESKITTVEAKINTLKAEIKTLEAEIKTLEALFIINRQEWSLPFQRRFLNDQAVNDELTFLNNERLFLTNQLTEELEIKIKQLDAKFEELRKENHFLEMKNKYLGIQINQCYYRQIFPIFELFNNRFNFDGKSTTSSNRKGFKPLLARDYLEILESDFHSGINISCQILGLELPSFLIVGGHLFKHEWASDAKILLNIDDIDHTSNGLLLFIPIEKAYNRSQLCFLKTSYDFCLKLLDPDLREVSLFEDSLKYITETECSQANKDKSEIISIVQGRLGNLTYGDLDGRKLICKGIARPNRRCLNFHAERARINAIKMGWIQPDVVFNYSWNEDFTDSGVLENYLKSFDIESDVDSTTSDSESE